MSKRIVELPAQGSIILDSVFPVEKADGTGLTSKQTIRAVVEAAQADAFNPSDLKDFMISINGRLQVKEPVDNVVLVNVELDSFIGEEGKRYALNGQSDRTLNGIYLFTGGNLTTLFPTTYFDSYGPGSLFQDNASGKLWFIPVTKNNSNVVDPETGIRPQEAFKFLELDRAMLSLDVLDKFENSGLMTMSEPDVTTMLFTSVFNRTIPTELLAFYMAVFTAYNNTGSSYGFYPNPIREITSSGIVYTIQHSGLAYAAIPNEGDFIGKISDAFLLDQIETHLTALPDGGYYYDIAPLSATISFSGSNPATLPISSGATFQVDVVGGTGPFTQVWSWALNPGGMSFFDATAQVTTLTGEWSPGTYGIQVEVTDSLGAIATATQVLEVV